MAGQLPVATVCRVLGAPRSSMYFRRATADAGGRPGPVPSISDSDLLVGLIRRVLDASPCAGEGYRKVRARLGREHGVQVSGKTGAAAAAPGRLVGPPAGPWSTQAAPP
jgi:hypothetical protein